MGKEAEEMEVEMEAEEMEEKVVVVKVGDAPQQ